MANNKPGEQGSNGENRAPAAPPQHAPSEPRVLMPSEIASAVQTIVASLELLAEQSQRRILESVRVQLGLMPQKDAQQPQRPPQRQPAPNQQQRRGS